MLWRPYEHEYNGREAKGRIFSAPNLAQYISENGVSELENTEISVKMNDRITGVEDSKVSVGVVDGNSQVIVSGVDGSGVHQDIHIQEDAEILVFYPEADESVAAQ